MFGNLFKRKKKEVATEPGLWNVRIDIHSHFIPGIDDGAQSVQDSLAMIREFKKFGYTHLYATPHVMWDSYQNTPEIILDGLGIVKKACEEEGIAIELNAAAEYFIDEHFIDMLEKGEPLLTLPGRRLLVELPYTTPLMNTHESLFHIIEKGYRPVLAHPERYTYYHSDPTVYQRFADQGCELQINALSFTRQYGEGVRKTAEWLLSHKLITYVGTDAHRIEHLQRMSKLTRMPFVVEYPYHNHDLFSAETV